MINSARVRVFAIGIAALVGYFTIYHETLGRHLQGHSLAYMVGLGSVILISGWYFAPQRHSTWLSWGAISPFFASAMGYAVVTTVSYFQHGAMGADISFGSRVLIALGFPYFACSVWTLSAALPFLGMLGQYLLPAANRACPPKSA